MVKELFAQEFDRSVKARRGEGIRFERVAADLDITVTTLHDWRKAESANIDLATLDRIADYFGWEIAVRDSA